MMLKADGSSWMMIIVLATTTFSSIYPPTNRPTLVHSKGWWLGRTGNMVGTTRTTTVGGWRKGGCPQTLLNVLVSTFRPSKPTQWPPLLRERCHCGPAVSPPLWLVALWLSGSPQPSTAEAVRTSRVTLLLSFSEASLSTTSSSSSSYSCSPLSPQVCANERRLCVLSFRGRPQNALHSCASPHTKAAMGGDKRALASAASPLDRSSPQVAVAQSTSHSKLVAFFVAKANNQLVTRVSVWLPTDGYVSVFVKKRDHGSKGRRGQRVGDSDTTTYVHGGRPKHGRHILVHCGH